MRPGRTMCDRNTILHTTTEAWILLCLMTLLSLASAGWAARHAIIWRGGGLRFWGLSSLIFRTSSAHPTELQELFAWPMRNIQNTCLFCDARMSCGVSLKIE